MKINIDNIILINLIILLNRNVVYCVDKNDVSLWKSKPITTVSTTNDTITNKYTSTVINANFASYREFEDREPLTIGFEYMIDKSQQDKLSHPNKIDKIKISDYIIEFDDNAKLPTGSVNDISIITCKHNNPVLIRFSCLIEGSICYYFYLLNNDTNKWNNHKLKYDKTYNEHTDNNGINYYKIDYSESTEPTTESTTCFCFRKKNHKSERKELENYKYEGTELARIHCNKGKCVKLGDIKIKDKNLEIYVKQLMSVNTPVNFDNPTSINLPTVSTTNDTITNKYTGTIINANIVEYCEFEDEPLTIGFRYTIDKSQQNKLSHPNKIDKIKFFDYIIEFDDDVKLPTIGTVNIIYIYTCEHNNPVLVEFIVSIEESYYFYFYSMNNNTNKWNNHKLKYDKRFKKYTKNGINCYEYVLRKCSSYTRKNEYEHKELARIHCNEEKCVNVKVDNIEKKNLEIYVK
uniref:Seroreactive antigen BMN1-10 n=1 Tax=Babesia microti TaxID=5868 RepID=Q9NIN0_BABMI|nr:seroreactive antigen BMN1-10 [Babesia microti]